MNARIRRVLIVEDELLIAMLMQAIVSEVGYGTGGPVGTGEEAPFLAGSSSIDLRCHQGRITRPHWTSIRSH
ncbi:hypothetical protein QFZ27_001712 [Inquilinus ginsengisoli]|uniref:hypothetical protein n=1 Tax=Inquilinus ginsengisoli TaxID=363840 RepID=UPI003D1C1E4B